MWPALARVPVVEVPARLRADLSLSWVVDCSGVERAVLEDGEQWLDVLEAYLGSLSPGSGAGAGAGLVRGVWPGPPASSELVCVSALLRRAAGSGSAGLVEPSALRRLVWDGLRCVLRAEFDPSAAGVGEPVQELLVLPASLERLAVTVEDCFAASWEQVLAWKLDELDEVLALAQWAAGLRLSSAEVEMWAVSPRLLLAARRWPELVSSRGPLWSALRGVVASLDSLPSVDDVLELAGAVAADR